MREFLRECLLNCVCKNSKDLPHILSAHVGVWEIGASHEVRTARPRSCLDFKVAVRRHCKGLIWFGRECRAGGAPVVCMLGDSGDF